MKFVQIPNKNIVTLDKIRKGRRNQIFHCRVNILSGSSKIDKYFLDLEVK